jgi:hypothetical protein
VTSDRPPTAGGAHAWQRGLGLNGPGGVEDGLAVGRIVPSGGQVREPAGESIDANHLDHVQARVGALLGQLAGAVEERRGEPPSTTLQHGR